VEKALQASLSMCDPRSEPLKSPRVPKEAHRPSWCASGLPGHVCCRRRVGWHALLGRWPHTSAWWRFCWVLLLPGVQPLPTGWPLLHLTPSLRSCFRFLTRSPSRTASHQLGVFQGLSSSVCSLSPHAFLKLTSIQRASLRVGTHFVLRSPLHRAKYCCCLA